MKKKLTVLALLAAFAAFAWWSLPKVPQPGERAPGLHAAHETALAEGEILSVERAAGNVNISHSPIASLDMPAMNMVFRADPALLQDAKPGEKVAFRADAMEGGFVVMSMRAGN